MNIIKEKLYQDSGHMVRLYCDFAEVEHGVRFQKSIVSAVR